MGSRKSTNNDTNDRPFRFYDNRQKYLAFINTTNEKWKIAKRVSQELQYLEPVPPALRVFDAGMGDATVLTNLMRSMHRNLPTMPFLFVTKEISLEDVRISLEKFPDRFVEHPSTVIVITNMNYSEAPSLQIENNDSGISLNWKEVSLEGDSSYGYDEQLRDLDSFLIDAWKVKSSKKTGNPIYIKPSVLVLYRKDYSFLLDNVIPRLGQKLNGYDLIIASQPWRARINIDFKVNKVLMPLSSSLSSKGRLLVIQSYGQDPSLEMVREVWPDEDPFKVHRKELIQVFKNKLKDETKNFEFFSTTDDESLFRYDMHVLPDELHYSIGTSTLFAAWNASIYVNQIEDERLEQILQSSYYLEPALKILKKYNGLWFNDESFVISKK